MVQKDRQSRHEHSRRVFLTNSALGLGSMALASMDDHAEGAQSFGRQHVGNLRTSLHKSQTGAMQPRHAPRAKNVIFLFMAGGPSHIDLFDPKPKLAQVEGTPIPDELIGDQQQFALIRGTPKFLRSPFAFSKQGESGIVVSELLPNLATVVDELTVIRSMQTDTNIHDPAVNLMNCGTPMFDHPTMGAWLSYGLGSENANLPSYLVMTSGADDGQPLLQSFWGSGFLESKHQGVPFLEGTAPILYLENPDGIARDRRRRQLDLLKWMNERQHDVLQDPEIKSRIESYELAFRMQASVPELTDLGRETKETLDSYGADPTKHSFANNCLLARRFVEQGVRFIQLYDRGWDSHTDIVAEHSRQCQSVDRPIAALIKDLKQRGMLDETLVIWGGEFGRTPVAQVSGGTYGRDHHPYGFTMWMAGGGLRPGMSFGETDEFGYHAVEDVVHVRDLHATILHLLGIDHRKLTFDVRGLEKRLTGVDPANVVERIIG